MRFFVTISLVLISLWGFSQQRYDYLKFNNAEWFTPFDLRVNSNGFLGIDLETLSASSPLQNTTNHFLKQAGIWICAEDANGKIYTAVQHLKEKGLYDFWPGPVDTLTGQTDPIANWDFVWKLTKQDIETHRVDYNKSTYQMPLAIKNWPANGSDGFSEVLAPFIDANNNKVYDPENGDYPYLKGDEMTYTIFNDLVDEHKASNGQELGLEVYLMAYLSNQLPDPITVLEYYIVSRTSQTYKNVNVGFYMEADESTFKAPKVGTRLGSRDGDLARSIFIYDSELAGSSMVLAQIPNMASSIAFNNESNYNRIPTTTEDYHNYLNGKWADSSSLTYGGIGKGGSSTTPYIFPNFEWKDTGNHNSILGVKRYEMLQKDNYIKFNIALALVDSTWRETESASLDFTTRALQQRDWLSSVHPLENNKEMKLFPNPSTGSFIIESKAPLSSFRVLNLQGITIVNKEIKNKLSWQCNESLSPGVYTILVETTAGIKTKKLIINP
jgi:hypothetical protein